MANLCFFLFYNENKMVCYKEKKIKLIDLISLSQLTDIMAWPKISIDTI